MALIEFHNVEKIYPGDFVALRDVTCAIDRGEFVSLIGSSGAGKSTFLKMIYAEEYPTSGKVLFGGKDVAKIQRRLLPFYRRNFGTVFQDTKLLEYKTIFENVAYTLEVQGAGDDQINEEVPKLLDIVGLSQQMEKYPHQVSGGEAQRAALARALIHRPRVLIADEPTGNLDPDATQDIIRLLQKINEFGTTVILATHDNTIIDHLKKRVIVINNHTIVRDLDENDLH